MLKKLLKSVEPFPNKSVFPIQTAKAAEQFKSEETNTGSFMKTIDEAVQYTQDITDILVNHQQFIGQLADLLTEKVLNILLSKYGFEPTDKYLEEIERKKSYVNQLNEYLEERKQINCNVEKELQQFLQNTTDNIRTALNEFSNGIHARIVEAENRYGIDKIKHIVLSSEPGS